MKARFAMSLVLVSGLVAVGCGANAPLRAAGRQVSVGPMGGEMSSQPATQPLGGSVSGPPSGYQPPGATWPGGGFGATPGAAWSQPGSFGMAPGGAWSGGAATWPPPPVMRAGPGLPYDYEEYKRSGYYPGTTYQAWKFWKAAQENPWFHHRERYPELPHHPARPPSYGAPGYPGGPGMFPGLGR